MTLPLRCALRLFLLALLSPGANAQTLGSVFGLVRDGSGSASPGVGLILNESGSPGIMFHATTDSLGAFHFDHLAFGNYLVSTDRIGDAIMPNGPFVLLANSPTVRVDLTLVAVESSTKHPALQLQAAGIRGYIDPGGYSAPAGAAAATKLIQGAADLNRANNDPADNAIACEREPVLLKASLNHPDNASAKRELGQYYLSTHQPEKALPFLQRAWSLDRHDPKTLLPLAEALLENRQFADTRDLLTRNAIGADQAEIHRLLARSDEGLGAFQQAATEYQTASALQPVESDLYGAGYELILAGNARAAVKVFEAGAERYPDSTTLLMGLGTADFLLGQGAEATRIFLRCATRHPNDSRLYPFLSASFAISGTNPDAVEASFRRYHELAPTSADAAYFYALFLMHRSSATTNAGSVDSTDLLQQAIHLEPGFAKAHLQLGSVYLDHGDYSQAIQQLTTAIRLDPEQWEARYRLSTAYRHAGQSDLAEQQMRLFLAHRNQNIKEDQLSDIHIEEFLSVLTPSNSKPSASNPCNVQK